MSRLASKPTELPEANQFANYLIQLTRREERVMTSYKLQGLLYYIQAWSLSQRNRPAFREDVRAWKDGPVVRAVFARFHRAFFVHDVLPDESHLSPEDQDLAESVWMLYRDYGGDELKALTHTEAPWMEARKGYAPGTPSDTVISPDTMSRECSGQLAATEKALASLADTLSRTRR